MEREQRHDHRVTCPWGTRASGKQQVMPSLGSLVQRAEAEMKAVEERVVSEEARCENSSRQTHILHMRPSLENMWGC